MEAIELPIDSTDVQADRASRLAEDMLSCKLATAIRTRASTRSSRIVHLLIHTWESRARRPRYGVMPSGFNGIIRPWPL